MSAINWNDGRLITINGGDTATCTGGLNPGQLYALFFYNSAQNQTRASVKVVWSNSGQPVEVTVPGTTQEMGLAALCFVSGDDTNTVSASILSGSSGVQVSAFIGSVKMPTNTNGITNAQLPLDGQQHPLTRFTRYYAVPQMHWYSATLQSDIDQFISVQFMENSAIVNIVNAVAEPDSVIQYTSPSTKDKVKVSTYKKQSTDWSFQGNGSQVVWINAESVSNTSSTLSVQSLSQLRSL